MGFAKNVWPLPCLTLVLLFNSLLVNRRRGRLFVSDCINFVLFRMSPSVVEEEGTVDEGQLCRFPILLQVLMTFGV